MDNIVLGRGELFFDPFVPGTEILTGERPLGNTPAFSLSVETQTLDHFNSDRGLRVKDLSVTLETNYSANFTTDNINADNVAMFFFGTTATLSQAAEVGNSDTLTVKQGRYYQLGQSPALISGKRNVTNVAITGSVEGTDFTVDATLGRLYIVPGGNIADDSTITVTYDVNAHSRSQVLSGSDQVYGALRFIAHNGVGEDKDFYMPKVSLSPNGEYALKGDDWQQISFNVEILRLGTNPNILVDGRPY